MKFVDSKPCTALPLNVSWRHSLGAVQFPLEITLLCISGSGAGLGGPVEFRRLTWAVT